MIVNKLWGYEIWIENNEKYCGKHLHVVPGKKCSVHYHKDKKETKCCKTAKKCACMLAFSCGISTVIVTVLNM